MTKARRKKTGTFTIPTGARRKGRKVESEVLSSKDWTVGALAWNKDGNIVILDPRLAQYLRQRARDDRELEIGIPTRSTKVEKRAGGEKDYDPYPDSGTTPVIGLRPPNPLGLCACEYIRLHLATEGHAFHLPLSTDAVDASTLVDH
jgi:hypothetical protein